MRVSVRARVCECAQHHSLHSLHTLHTCRHAAKHTVGAQRSSLAAGSPLPPHPLHPVPAPSAVVAPQDLQLLKSTEESLQVGWTPAGEADHYLLSYHPLGAELSAEQVRVPGQQHSYEILGLLPGTKYLVTLRSVKKEVSSSPRHLLATTGEAAAGVPGSPGETQF